MKIKRKLVAAFMMISFMCVGALSLSGGTCTVSSTPANNDGHCVNNILGLDVCYMFGKGPACESAIIQE